MEQRKIVLADSEIPRQWYNILADLPTPMCPPLHPGTGKPVRPEDLAPVFPMNLIEQEVSTERWIDIPEPVLEKYLLWRPTPLCRAHQFRKAPGCARKDLLQVRRGESRPARTSPTRRSRRPITTRLSV